MKAIKKLKKGIGFELVNVPQISKPKKDEVKIKMLYSSICGTDVHIYKWDQWSQENIKTPHTNGHEGVGQVEAIGSDVTNVKIGDIVAYETHNYCNKCHVCKQGNTHICKKMTILGVNIEGVWQEKVKIPNKILFKIPNNSKIPLKYYGILEPFGNAHHALSYSNLEDRNVLITGDGPIGIFASFIARAHKAKRVFLTGVNPKRLEIAKKCGINVINVHKMKKDDLDKHLLKLTQGKGIDVVGEFSGQPSVLQDAIRIINPGGDINVLSIYHTNRFPIEINHLVLKNIQMHFVCGRRIFKTWTESFNMINSGQIKLEHIDKVITHKFKLEEFEKAFKVIMDGDAGKVLLQIANDQDIEKLTKKIHKNI